MTAPASAAKRARATAMVGFTPVPPTSGNLEVHWDSHFDAMCYEVSTPALARKQPERYSGLLTELATRTGCTEEELLTHGFKVRSILFFAEDRLARQGLLANLVGTQQHCYRLAAVTHSF